LTDCDARNDSVTKSDIVWKTLKYPLLLPNMEIRSKAAVGKSIAHRWAPGGGDFGETSIAVLLAVIMTIGRDLARLRSHKALT
jgi:hypothetical protein